MYDQQKGEKDDSSLVYRERKKGGSKVMQQAAERLCFYGGSINRSVVN